MAVPGRSQIVFPRLTSVVKKLIITLVVAYTLQLVLQFMGIEWASLLVLNPGTFAPWQLVTYLLIGGSDPFMFLLGLVFLWWALSPFEVDYGPTRTMQLCAAVVLIAALPVWMLGFVAPMDPLLGSYPLWFGGLAAKTWPERRRQMSFFGLFSMTGVQFLLLLLFFAVLQFLWYRSLTSLVSAVAAMAGGIGFVTWMARPKAPPRIRRAKPRPPGGFKVIRGGGGGGGDDDERPKYLN